MKSFYDNPDHRLAAITEDLAIRAVNKVYVEPSNPCIASMYTSILPSLYNLVIINHSQTVQQGL